VDASGDAAVAHLASVATVTVPLPDRQLASLVFVLQQVDTEALGPGPRVALLRLLPAPSGRGACRRALRTWHWRRRPSREVVLASLR